jgi:lauroyl/myristoyl acyltransferase
MTARAEFLRSLTDRLPAPIATGALWLIGVVSWWRPRCREGSLAHIRLLITGTPREPELRRLARSYERRRRGMDYRMLRPELSAGAAVYGVDVLRDIRAAGRAAIIAYVHLFNITPQIYALGSKFAADALVLSLDEPRTPVQLRFERIFGAMGFETIAAAGSFELVLTRLREGRICQIAVDVPGSTACTFLGRPAKLASGPAALAFASGAPIVPVVPRLRRGKLEVHVLAPLEPASFTDAAALTQRVADIFGPEILAAADGYEDNEWLPKVWAA